MDANISSFGDLDITIKGTSKKATDSIQLTITMLDSLEKRLGSFSVGASTTQLRSLADALTEFSAVPKPNLTKANATAIQAISEAANLISADTSSRMMTLAQGLKAFNEVAPQKLAQSATQFARLPKALKDIQDVDFTKMTPQIDQLVKVMTPLADTMERIGSGFNAMPPKIQQYIKGMAESTKETNKAAKAQKGLIGWLQSARSAYMAVAFAATRVSKFVGGMVHQSNMYIENLNLFTITMGRATQASLDYAEALRDAVGIDPADWIKQQGIFKQIVGGFGVAEEEANHISKNLTQLVYDSTSYFNTTVEEAAQKFEAALAQQSRPLRRFGYDISMTALREEALAMGIEKSVDMMTRAEKAQLTYMVIMKQSRNVMGDMARTIITPANALRILGMQAQQAKRALGNALLPAIQGLLPYFIALVEVIRYAGDALARFFGYEPPKIDYSKMDAKPLLNVADAFEDIESGAQGANKAVKEFKNFLLGFDELHVIPTQGGGTGGAGGGGVSSGDLFSLDDLPGYDFLEQLAPQNTKIQKVKDDLMRIMDWIGRALEPLLEVIKSIGIYLIASLVGKSVLGAISKFRESIGWSAEAIKLSEQKWKGVGWLLGAALIGGFSGYFLGKQETLGEITSGQAWLGRGVSAGITTLLGAKGAMALGATGPWGLAIGAGITLVTQLVGHIIGVKTATEQINKEAKLDEFTGSIKLADNEVVALVDRITTSDYSLRVKVFADSYADMVTIGKEVDTALTEMNKTQRLIQLGAEIELEDYAQTINDYFDSVNRYVAQQEEVLTLAVELVFGSGEWGKGKIAQLGAWHETQQDELKDLEDQISEILQDHLERGIDAIETDNAIKKYVDKYDEIVSGLREFEQDVATRKLQLDLERLTGGFEFGMSDLDLESWHKALDKIRQHIDSTSDSANEALSILIESAMRTFEAGSEELNEEVKTIYQQHYYELLMHYASVHGSFYSDALLETASIMPGEALAAFELNTAGYTGLLDAMLGENDRLYTDMLSNVTKAEKQAAEEMYASVRDIVWVEGEDLKRAYAAGAEPPTEFIEGFRDHMVVGALAGDVDAMNYLIGEQMTKSPSAIELLASAEGVGANIPEYQKLGILSNVSVVEDTLGQLYAKIDGKLYTMTPELYGNLEDIGYHFPDNFDTGVLKAIPGMTYRQDLFDNLYNFAQDKAGDWVEIKELLGTKGITAITDAFDTIGNYTDYSDFIRDALTGIYTETDISTIETFYGQHSKAIDAFFNDAKKHKGILDDLFTVDPKTINLKVSTVGSGMKANVTVTRGMTYATGGYPEAGELFTALEGGELEMMGRQGRKTIVANNLQIIEGISHGVAEGMMTAAAITGGGGDKSDSGDMLIVQIGNEVVYQATMAEAKRQSQRTGKAAVIMG